MTCPRKANVSLWIQLTSVTGWCCLFVFFAVNIDFLNQLSVAVKEKRPIEVLIADIELSSRVNRTLMNEFDHRSFLSLKIWGLNGDLTLTSAMPGDTMQKIELRMGMNEFGL